MRQNVVVKANSPTQIERLKVLKVAGLQAGIALLTAIIAGLLKGSAVMIFVLLGAMACLLPSLVFSWCMLAKTSAKTPKKLAVVFFIGEIGKLLVMAAAIAALIIINPGHLLAVLLGFAATQLGAWLAMTIVDLDRTKGEPR